MVFPDLNIHKPPSETSLPKFFENSENNHDGEIRQTKLIQALKVAFALDEFKVKSVKIDNTHVSIDSSKLKIKFQKKETDYVGYVVVTANRDSDTYRLHMWIDQPDPYEHTVAEKGNDNKIAYGEVIKTIVNFFTETFPQNPSNNFDRQ